MGNVIKGQVNRGKLIFLLFCRTGDQHSSHKGSGKLHNL